MTDKINSQLPNTFNNEGFLRYLTLAHLRFVPEDVEILMHYHGVIQENLAAFDEDAKLRKAVFDVSLHYYCRGGQDPCYCFDGEPCWHYVDLVICPNVSLTAGFGSHPWPFLQGALGLLKHHRFTLQDADPSVIEDLLENGADPNQLVASVKRTIWHQFLRKLIIETKANPEDRCSTLHRASATVEECTITEHLLKFGADTDSLVDCSRLEVLLNDACSGEQKSSLRSVADIIEQLVQPQHLLMFSHLKGLASRRLRRVSTHIDTTWMARMR